MSSVRKGPTRIPTFGSRIPLPGQISSSSSTTTTPSSETVRLFDRSPVREQSNQIALCSSDVGRKVRVNDKDGVLRFIGNVHFAVGTWCGVQVAKGCGKNDGLVRGVRYFLCPKSCGLMTPLSKVTAIEDLEDRSGPYSMLFGIGNETKTIIRSRTFDKIESPPDANSTAYENITSFEKLNNVSFDRISNSTFDKLSNATFDKLSKATFEKLSNATFEKLGNATFDKLSNVTYEKVNNVTFEKLNNVTFEKLNKRSNATFEKVSNATFEKINNTFEEDDPADVTMSKESKLELNEIIVSKRNFVLENLIDYNSPNASSFAPGKAFNFSTPVNKLGQSPLAHLVDEEINKRDSLEFEESLGILTPDQMIDVTTGLVGSRTPSSENIRLLPHDELSPKMESSIKEFSLGLIDEHILSALTMRTDAMNLTLDSHNDSKVMARIEQTPSPEELPLDPTPIVDSKSDNKKPPNSFITSITSITSLDTGYQGDGEMSRPASRGADNSPLTRRPQPRPPPRRPDPMTDSDFYTESDADNHEDHPLRGDRKAQVIDGTLYGVDPQAAADIYANNRENMDSSGIFTDIERTDDLSSADNIVEELSPSDSSTKTISDDSQNNINLIVTKTPTNEPPAKTVATPPVTPSPNSTVASSPASTRSPRHLPKTKEDSATKKYKMPKRNVASKVKAMIEPCNKENEKRPLAATKKPAGRWDAVMNKISKSPPEIKNLKEVKSKVFSSIAGNLQRNDSGNKLNTPSSLKSPNNKLRRVRTRAANNTTPNKNTGSINSSLSDLSGASPAKINGSAKKQRDVVRVTQVLTAAKLSPKANNHSVNTEAKNKSNAGHINHDTKSINRNLFSTAKDKKKDPTKEIGRATVKGGRVSPGTRPHAQPRVPLKPPVPRTAEALAVLVQHLVFNLEAFKNPSLKKELERMRLDAEEVRLSYKQLEETLGDERMRHLDVVKDERNKYRAEITQLIERHRNEILQLNIQHEETLKIMETERKASKDCMLKQHEDQMRALKVEIDKLQKTHEESLDILREENDAIREEIDEKNARIRELESHRCESEKLRKDYEAKEVGYKEQLIDVQEEAARLRAENETLFTSRCSGTGENSYQEVQSLRAVLELKQREIAELRKALAEAAQKADQLPGAEEKIAMLMAKCEDMQHQVERKNEYETQLLSENRKLQESFKEEFNQKKRLSQYNEELQWKLQQNKEVVTKVLEEAEASALTRSMLSASFNERHSSVQRPNIERTLSFRERSLSNKSNVSHCSRKSKNSFDDLEDLSPPSSPKVKGVVEKSDSVSYVLEMDESPEVVASRIVRRSFRNATPPKNTPTKSPSNKRPRMKNNLCLSSSTSSIVPGIKADHLRSRSASVRNGDENNEDIFLWETQHSSTPNPKKFDVTYWSTHGDFDEDLEDIKLPSLPSEIGNKHCSTLPVPKHLAGEAMISESNSEDECSTSSSSGQL